MPAISQQFELHPRLAADTHFVADWPLCRVLLMNDARYRWLILVPRRAGAVELHRLSDADQAQAMNEITKAAKILENLGACDKINIGALGNLVPQLHIHVLARTTDDPAWPGPVWGIGVAVPYSSDVAKEKLAGLRAAFGNET